MPNYENTKIYAIKSTKTPLIYIGATTKLLCQRMAQHRRDNKKQTFECPYILEFPDSHIELIKTVNVSNKEELNKELYKVRNEYRGTLAPLKEKNRKKTESKEENEEF